MKIDERGFEDAIEASLLAGGYLKSVPSDFNAALGLDTGKLFEFLGATQPRAWESLVGRYGNDRDAAQQGFAKRLAAELDQRGTVDVLRHGVVDLGVTLALAYFRPAHGLTPELGALYADNRVSVTRQLPYDPTVEHAITQYRTDRNPANVTLPSCPGALRRRPRPRCDDHQARRGRDAVSPLQPRPRRRRRQTHPTSTDTAPSTCGSGSGPATRGWTSSPGSSTSAVPRLAAPRPREPRRSSSSPATTNGMPCSVSKPTRAPAAPGSTT